MSDEGESERDERCARLKLRAMVARTAGLDHPAFDPSLGADLTAELEVSAQDRKDLKAPTWRRVEDELPELDVDVLVCCFNPVFHNQRRYVFVNHLNHHPSHWAKGHKVTHWMPLPGPPNA